MHKKQIEIKENLRGKSFIFQTQAGVFSKWQVDPGSRLLIESMEIKPNDLILDLGCGYGPIGIVAACLAHLGKAILIDANIRAVRLSEQNFKLNRIKNAQVLLSDGLEEVKNQQFDVILCNPPASSGIEIFEEFTQDSYNSLTLAGKLYFVTQDRLKDAVQRTFKKYFGNYKVVARNPKYLVSLAIKS